MNFLKAFYGCAGIGLYLASIMEWILGNTFPAVVFGTFGKVILENKSNMK